MLRKNPAAFPEEIKDVHYQNSFTKPHTSKSKIIKQDCPYELYRHATRADSAELATEKTCRPATAKKIDLDGILIVTK